jgi:TOBE domain
VTVLIRPEQLEIAPGGPAAGEHPDCLAGRVVACDYYGHDAVVRVRPDTADSGGDVIVRTTGGPQLPAGAPVLVRARGPVIAWASS